MMIECLFGLILQYKFIMGQKQGKNNSIFRSLEEEWKPHPLDKDVYFHTKSQLQVQKFHIIPNQIENNVLQKRIKDNHAYVARVFYFEEIISSETNRNHKQQANVYAERLFPMKKKNWLFIETALSILKGFRRLSGIYGYFQVTKSMITINADQELRLWIHEHPLACEPQKRVDSQQQMVHSVVKIISENDPITSHKIKKAANFNEAINNILINMPKNTSFKKEKSQKITHIENMHPIQRKKDKLSQSKKIFQKIFPKESSNLQNSTTLAKTRMKKSSHQLLHQPFHHNFHQYPNKTVKQLIPRKTSLARKDSHFQKKNCSEIFGSVNLSSNLQGRHSSNDFLHDANNQDFFKIQSKRREITHRNLSIGRIREDEEYVEEQAQILPQVKIKEVNRVKTHIPMNYRIDQIEEMVEKARNSTQHSTLEKIQNISQIEEKKEKNSFEESFTKYSLTKGERIEFGEVEEEKNKKIKQKLERKKQTFAELKSEALKLLKQQALKS